jgi:hypothetical protein
MIFLEQVLIEDRDVDAAGSWGSCMINLERPPCEMIGRSTGT